MRAMQTHCKSLVTCAGLAVLMGDFQTEMNRVVSDFVASISDLARRAAIDTLENALGRAPSVRGRTRTVGRGVKRPAEALDRLSDQFVAFVGKNPGLRVEQINKELGTTTRDLALPIRKLVANGVIKTKGKKRSTTYFAK